MIISKILIVILSLIGLFIIFNIFKEKRSKKPMVCPLNMNCSTVLSSNYSKFLGIHMEYLGLIYYLYILIAYSAMIFIPGSRGGLFELTTIWVSVFGFTFSLYLLIVQAFYLKAFCSWCLSSLATSTIIFTLALKTLIFNFPNLEETLTNYSQLFHLSDILIVSFGTALVLIIEIISIKFLRDFKISEKELSVFKILHQILWLVLFDLLIITLVLNFLNSTNEFMFSTTRNIKTIVIYFLTSLSSFYLLPKIYKNNSENINNVRFITLARIIQITIGGILISTWFFLPASSLEVYALYTTLIVLIVNIFVFYKDFSQLKIKK